MGLTVFGRDLGRIQIRIGGLRLARGLLHRGLARSLGGCLLGGGIGGPRPGFCRRFFLGIQIDLGQFVDGPVSQRVQIQLTHLGDVLRQRLNCPVLHRNRRKYRDIDRARINDGGVPRGDELSVADHDRDDRDPHGHRDAERPLLERPHFGGVDPGAFWSDHYREPVLSPLFDRVQRLHRGDRIVPVDEHAVQQLAERTHDRILFQFFLADANPVVAHQRAGNDRVNLVAVIEDKHRRTLCGQILFADDIEMHATGREQQLGKGGGEEINAAPPVTGQHTDPHRTGSNREHRAEADKCSQLPPEAHATATVESQNRPATALGHGGHLSLGIGRPWIADQIHQGDVLVTVGIKVAVLEIDVVDDLRDGAKRDEYQSEGSQPH